MFGNCRWAIWADNSGQVVDFLSSIAFSRKKEYLAQYFIGHYNPRGNHFCAFAVKDPLIRMLDPKPVPYRQDPSILP